MSFIDKNFIGFDYKTLEGGELRLMIAPQTKDKNVVNVVMAHTTPDGKSSQTLCHITQQTAAELFYQMNMFLDIFDNVKINEPLMSEVKSNTFDKFKTLDTVDIRCDCDGELEIL